MRGADCVLWEKAIRKDGYGHAWDGEKVALAHRVVYEREVGPIPEGQHLHHVCGNRACVNVEHLRILTPTEHRRERMRPHCPHGHPYSGVRVKANGKTQRVCRECNLEAARRFRCR